MDEFDTYKPIYLQLADRIKLLIVSQELKAGEKLPSIRDMAIFYNVNPNTIQRTYSELEREDILVTKRGQGTFVTEQKEQLADLRGILKEEQILMFVQEMKEMGYNPDEIILGLQHYLKKGRGYE
ncbi:GntR family transcriptional regulator [Paenibacillus taichungensis]